MTPEDGHPAASVENSAAEVAALLAYIRSLQREFDLSIMLVHPTRKNGAAGVAVGQALRGSGDLHAFGDSNLYLKRTGELLRLASEHLTISRETMPGIDVTRLRREITIEDVLK